MATLCCLCGSSGRLLVPLVGSGGTREACRWCWICAALRGIAALLRDLPGLFPLECDRRPLWATELLQDVDEILRYAEEARIVVGILAERNDGSARDGPREDPVSREPRQRSRSPRR